ncbi:ATP-dependent DNA helicase [Myxococcota bacterium]|nr:ATP-dependent DNA helicase [Myxococcota bacterium]
MPRPSVDDILGTDGALAAASSGFEPREGQRALARAVASVFAEGGVLLAEAGTGTGKTLAYLAAAVATGRRVVVSTATRTLQDQIVRKDVPRLQAAVGADVVAAVLKGRSNYLCLWRLEPFRLLPGDGLRGTARTRLLRWAEETTSGDRAEHDALPEDHPVWDRLTTTSETCLGGRCPHYARCFVTRARGAAEAADLVVVNHHLYFGDAAIRAAGGALLPEHDAVVFDEAHAVPEIAAQFFGAQVSTQRLAGFLADLEAALGAAPPTFEGGAGVRTAALGVAGAAEALFGALRGGAAAPRDSTRLPFGADALTPAIRDAHLALDATLLEVFDGLDGAGDAPGTEALGLLRARAGALRDDLERLLEPSTPGWVFFRDVRPTGVSLSGQPIEPAEPLRRHVLPAAEAVVFTSATLTVGGGFDYLRARLGLEADEFEGRPVATAAFESPFDYATQARLYLPAGLPLPDAPEFTEALVGHVRALTALTRGRAFVLFTSHRGLDAAHARLRAADAPDGPFPFPLLRQGEAPRTALIERFRETPGAVLLGTSTFWEGVDVAGDALSLVIIDKLPFESPGDPVLQARLERCRERGGNPFMELQVPAAALALAQGFGRLIRTRTDRGIVAVLDPRLTSRPYGRRMLAGLPPAPVVTTFEAVSAWWSGGPAVMAPSARP